MCLCMLHGSDACVVTQGDCLLRCLIYSIGFHPLLFPIFASSFSEQIWTDADLMLRIYLERVYSSSMM